MPSLERIVTFFGFLLVTVALYLPALGFAFTYDDFTHIHNNPLVVRQGFSWEQVVSIFSSSTAPGNLYRPLTIFSYYLQNQLFGISSSFFHLLNIVLHAINAFLVYLIISKLLTRNELVKDGQDSKMAKPVSLAVATLFLLTPLHVEAVANVAGRPELLAFFFGALAFLVFIENKLPLLGALLLLLACCSKESAIVWSGIVVSYFVLSTGLKEAKQFYKRAALTVLPAVLFVFVRILVLGDKSLIAWSSDVYHPENPFQYLAFSDRIYPSLVYLGRYLYLSVLPFPLSADYSAGLSSFWGFCFSLKGFLHVALLATYGGVVVLSKRYFFGLWFFIGFLVTCNLLIPIGTLMGERLAYLPSVGVLTFMVLNFCHIIRSIKLLSVVFLLFCLVFAFGTRARLPVWQSDLVLFEQTFKDAPQSVKPAVFLSGYWFREKKNFERTRYYLEHIYRLDPTNLYCQKMLVHLCLKEQRIEEAKLWVERILKVDPEDEFARKMHAGISSLESSK